MKKKFKKVILFLFPTILFFPMIASAQWSMNNVRGFGLPGENIQFILLNLMEWILGIVGFFAIIGFSISGIMYLTSSGDEERQKKAKSAMLYSIIGVVVALGGYVIWTAVQEMLEGSATDF